MLCLKLHCRYIKLATLVLCTICNTVVFSQTCSSDSIGFASQTSWFTFDSTHLSEIDASANNVTLTWSDSIRFDEENALRVDFSNNGYLEIPYQYVGESMWSFGYFGLAFYSDDLADATDDAIKIQFIENGSVEMEYLVYAQNEQRWRYAVLIQSKKNDKIIIQNNIELNHSNNLFPNKPDKVRIVFPNKSGKAYIGLFFLGKESRLSAVDYWERGRKAPEFEAQDYNIPDFNSVTVSTADSSAISDIATRLDAYFNADNVLDTVPMDDMNILQEYYNQFFINPNCHPIVAKNILLNDTQDAINTFGVRLLEMAQLYRQVQDVNQKQQLYDWYRALYEYAVYTDVMPSFWSGNKFLESVFVMRTPLKADGLLTDTLIREWIITMGMNRIYLDYSFVCRYFGRSDYANERGANVDFLRMNLRSMVALAIMDSDYRRNKANLERFKDWCDEFAFRISPGVVDGYKSDGNAYHHTGMLDLYAYRAIEASACTIYALHDTPWAIGSIGHDIVRHAAFAKFDREMFNVVPVITSAKSGSLYRYGGPGSGQSYSDFGLLSLAGREDGTKDTAAIQRFLTTYAIENLQPYPEFSRLMTDTYNDFLAQGETPLTDLSSNRIFQNGACAMHKRNDFLVAIKGHSKYEYARESSDDLVTYIGNGAMQIVKDYWFRYDKIKQRQDYGLNGFDHRLMPGTTSVNFANTDDMAHVEWKQWRSNATFVGGASQENNGIFTVTLDGGPNPNLDSQKAKKSYFFFDDHIVCIGSAINNIVNEETVTTICQERVRNVTDDIFYVDNTTPINTDYTFDQQITDNHWILTQTNIGYYIRDNQHLKIKREEVTNKDITNTNDLTGTFLTAYLSHGNAPANAAYTYIVKPEASITQMQTFETDMTSAIPPFEILAQTDELHAVKNNLNNSYGIVAHNENGQQVNVGDIKAVDNHCVLLVKEISPDVLEITITNADTRYKDIDLGDDLWGYSLYENITITMDGEWLPDGNPPHHLTIGNDGDDTTFNTYMEGGSSRTFTVKKNCVNIQLHAYLEGAYDSNTNEMTTILNTQRGLLPGQTPISNLVSPTPSGQPYNTAPWNYNGTEGAYWTDANYAGDETDWILLSFRTDIQKSTEVGMTAGLLKKDGGIHLPNRCALDDVTENSLYIVLEHRNHIGIMTPQPIDILNDSLIYDFRLSDSYRDQTSFGQKQLPTGEWCLFAGDADQSDFPSFDINGTDKTIWFDNNGIFDYYFSPDFNLDGDINGQDKSLWFDNNGISSRVPK